jgi:hypothetical protein
MTPFYKVFNKILFFVNKFCLSEKLCIFFKVVISCNLLSLEIRRMLDGTSKLMIQSPWVGRKIIIRTPCPHTKDKKGSFLQPLIKQILIKYRKISTKFFTQLKFSFQNLITFSALKVEKFMVFGIKKELRNKFYLQL